jgi:hypothetical protein
MLQQALLSHMGWYLTQRVNVDPLYSLADGLGSSDFLDVHAWFTHKPTTSRHVATAAVSCDSAELWASILHLHAKTPPQHEIVVQEVRLASCIASSSADAQQMFGLAAESFVGKDGRVMRSSNGQGAIKWLESGGQSDR